MNRSTRAKKTAVLKVETKKENASARRRKTAVANGDLEEELELSTESIAEDQDNLTQKTGDKARKSGRKRTPQKYVRQEALTQDEIDKAMEMIDNAVKVNESLPAKMRPRGVKRKAKSTDAFPNVDIDIVDENLTKSYQRPKRGRKRILGKQAFIKVDKPKSSNEDGTETETEDEQCETEIEKYLSHIQKPRSSENEKYKFGKDRKLHSCRLLVILKDCLAINGEEATFRAEEQKKLQENRKLWEKAWMPRSPENCKYDDVYKTIPKLRSVSPPRFSTKGIMKKKLDCKALGVKIVGKTLGNPFSNFGKKKNGIVYGNQNLQTVEEVERFSNAADKVRNVLKKQSESIRISSYVPPQVLKTARDKNVQRKQRRGISTDEDVDVDIETIDDSYVALTPESPAVPTKRRHNRGRKPGKTILQCEDCGYKTTHSGHMKIHILCVHKDIKMLECQYPGCGYQCARKGSMTRHEKCVHRKDKVFKCELCSFESAWSISLERHIITKHEKLRPWTCQICNKSFGQQFTLTQHTNTIHKKIKRIRCAFCTFRSTTKLSVRSHILRMHKDEIAKAVNEVEESPENIIEVEVEV